jgi:hypothetical protein
MEEQELKKALEKAEALAKAANAAVAKAEARADAFQKGFNVLAGHLAGHHEAMHKIHSEMHGMCKAKHEAMDDGDVQKGFIGHMASHHGASASEHKDAKENCAQCMKAVEDQLKKVTPIEGAPAAAAAPSATDAVAKAGDAVTGMIDKTMEAVLAKSLETISGSGQIEELVQTIVLNRVQEILGAKTVPTAARGVLPDVPGGMAAKLVPRTGSAPIDTANLDPEMVSVFGNEG